MVLFEEKRWRIKENFTLFRVEKSVMAPLLVTASGSSSGSGGAESGGGWSVRMNSLSMRIIWLKLGLMLGSSTQHDCMMKARSGDMSSGRLGLSCCNPKWKSFMISKKFNAIWILRGVTKKGYYLYKYGQWKNKFWWYLCKKLAIILMIFIYLVSSYIWVILAINIILQSFNLHKIYWGKIHCSYPHITIEKSIKAFVICMTWEPVIDDQSYAKFNTLNAAA